jgi:hypothetical protein
MKDNTRKLLLYLQPMFTYWKKRPAEDFLNPEKYKLGHHPLSFKPRIAQGHYTRFDENGLPLNRLYNGDLGHFTTTMCSYCFGNWELFLETGDKKYAEPIIKTAEYFYKNHVYQPAGFATVLWYLDKSETAGKVCGMDQGEAISVLARAYCLTNDEKYLRLAADIAKTFRFGEEDNGVTKNIPGTNDPWYLEGSRFILNGHVYSVIGLWELWRVTGEPEHKELFETGHRSVCNNIQRFDVGFWSIYMLDAPDYNASIMYHNLHICQLRILNDFKADTRLLQYANKFERYAANPINRMRAGVSLFTHKIFRPLKKA